MIVGPEPWQNAVLSMCRSTPQITIVANTICDRSVDIHDLPQSDVVLIAVDGEQPEVAIDLALGFQSKDRGTGVVLVLPDMSMQHLRAFHTYQGSWSLISANASGDPGLLGTVVQSAGRGLSWVEPAVAKLLSAFDNPVREDDLDIGVAGLDDFLDKMGVGTQSPTRPENVVSPVEGANTETGGLPEPPTGAGGATILVADDEEDVRFALQTLLEDAGYAVIEADDGTGAVELARSESPDAILLDVMMPVMNGMVALRNLKEDPSTRDIPVILVTAMDARDQRATARVIGASDFIHKPWAESEVENAVAVALASRASEGPPRGHAAA